VSAGLAKDEALNVLTRLVALRLIYPDGTISKLAQQYLRNTVQPELGFR
jgi:hypothetical protein